MLLPAVTLIGWALVMTASPLIVEFCIVRLEVKRFGVVTVPLVSVVDDNGPIPTFAVNGAEFTVREVLPPAEMRLTRIGVVTVIEPD
jgi:hypothetical protein